MSTHINTADSDILKCAKHIAVQLLTMYVGNICARYNVYTMFQPDTMQLRGQTFDPGTIVDTFPFIRWNRDLYVGCNRWQNFASSAVALRGENCLLEKWKCISH